MDTESHLVLKLTNPTDTESRVKKKYTENRKEIKMPLGHNYLLNEEQLDLKSGMR